MVSANSCTRRRYFVFVALVLGLWLSAGLQSRSSSAQSRPTAATAHSPSTASPEQARQSEQIAQQQARFERAKRSVAGEAELTARYRSALQQACALPRHTLSWQALGPGQISKNNLCEALAATETKPFNPLEANGWNIEAGAITPDAQQWWAGAGINGLWRGSATGWQNVLSGFVGLTVSTTQDATNQSLYVARQGWELLKSTDAGRSFSLVSLSPAQQQTDDSLPVAPFAISTQSEDLWTGGRYLWRSTNDGAQWQRASRALPSAATARFSAIAVAPSNPALVVAGTDQGELFRLDFARQADEQTSWPGVQPRAGFITSLTFDPQDNNIVYATYGTFGGAHIWKSTNGGATWLALDNAANDGDAATLPDVPVNAMAVDPNDGQRLYVGTDLGVFATFDGGAHWRLLAADFGATSVRNLMIRQTEAGKRLFAFTQTQGLWSAQLPASSDADLTQQCGFSFAPTGITFESSGGSGSIAVSAAASCGWNVETQFPWVQLTEGITGTGDGRVSFTIAANPNSTARNAYLLIGGRYFWLTQQGANTACTPVPLSSGSIASGELSQYDCLSSAYPGKVHYADRYTFAGRKGEFMVIGVTKLAEQLGSLGMLRLVSPTGEVIQDNNYPQNEVRMPGYSGGLRELPATGNYVFEVTSREPQQTFSYKVSLQLTSVGCNRYDVTPLDRYFDPARTTGRVAISTLPGCRWDALSTVPWLTFNPTNQGSGNALLEFTVASNTTGGVRSGNVEIAGQRFTVTQAGGNGNCVPLPLAIGATVNGAFSANDCFNQSNIPSGYGPRPTDRYQFSGRARQRLQFTLSGVSRPLAYPSIVLTNARGDILDYGNARLPNGTGFFELPSDGLYLVEVGAGLDTNPMPYTFSLLERNEGCSYGLTPLQREFEAAGGTGAFQLSTNTSCPWTVLPLPDWITVTPGISGQGSVTLQLAVAPNPDDTVRRTLLNVAGQTALITQAGTQGTCTTQAISSGSLISARFTASDCPPQLYPGGAPLDPPNCGCSSVLPVADRYLFQANSTQQFSLLLNTTGISGVAGGYALADAQGRVLKSGTFTAGQATPPVGLPAAGEYVLELLPFGTTRYSYNFQVNLTPLGCEAAGQINRDRFDAAGGTGTLAITAGAGCVWRATANTEAPFWLTLNGTGAGSGNASLGFTVAPNPYSHVRVGTLQLGTQTFRIEQAGVGGSCQAVEITPGQLINGEVTAGDCPALYADRTQPSSDYADRYTFSGVAGQQVALTSVTPQPNLSGQRTTPALTLIDPRGQLLSGTRASRTPDGAYLLTVTGRYTVEVTAHSGPYQLLVELTTPGCAYFVRPELLRFGNTASAHTLNVAAGTGCQWTPRASADWLTVSPPNATGNATLTLTLARNETPQARRASVLVAGQSVEIEQAGSGGDCLPQPLVPNTPVTGTFSSGDCPFQPFYNTVADRYSFTARAGDQVLFTGRINTNNLGSAPLPGLYLYDTFGNSVTGASNRQVLFDKYVRLAAAGVYFVEVVNAPSPFTYTLEMKRLSGVCEITVPEMQWEFTQAGGSGALTVRTGSGCDWTARVNAPWLTIGAVMSGTGPGTINFTVAEFNSNSYRDGFLYVEDQAIFIRQRFVPTPSAACQPRPLAFGQTVSAALTTTDCVLPNSPPGRPIYADYYSFEANAGQRLAFEAPLRQIQPYLTISDAYGHPLGQGTGRVPNGPNDFIILNEGGRYVCEVVSSSASATGNYTIKLVAPNTCAAVLTFANAPRPFDAQLLSGAGGTGTVKVVTGESCPWTVQSNEPWLAVSGSGTGPGTFTFAAQPNTTGEQRVARLFVNQVGQNEPSGQCGQCEGVAGLLVEQLSRTGDCNPRPLTSGLRVRGSLQTGSCRAGATWFYPVSQALVDRYQFTAQAGDQLVAVQELTGLPGLGRGYFSLLDPDGQAVGSGAEIHLPPPTGLSLMPSGALALAKSGVYTLRYAASQPAEYAFTLGLTTGGCGMLLPAEPPLFMDAGGTGSLSFQAAGNCAWTALSLSDWITLNAATGTGGSTLSYTVAPNPGAYRVGAISVGGRNVEVLQTGAGGSCAPVPLTPGQVLSNELTVRDCQRAVSIHQLQLVDRYSFTARAGEHVFIKVSAAQVLSAALLSAANLKAAQPLASSDWQGNVSYTVSADGEYVVEVFYTDHFNTRVSVPYTLRLQMLPPGCGIAVNPALAEFGSAGGTGSVSITAGCQYQILSSHDWLTISGSAALSGNQTLSFNVAPNPTTQARTGTIGIGGHPFTIEQAGTGGQCTAQSIAPGQLVAGQLNRADCPARMPLQVNAREYADRYVFNGTAGQLAQVLGPVLPQNWQTVQQIKLYDPSGTLIAGNPITNLRLPSPGDLLRLPSSGVYTLEIAANLPNSPDAKFDYTLLLTLLPPACSFTITPGNLSIAASGGSSSLTVATAASCPWQAAANVPWISFATAAGSGNGQVTFTVAANPTDALRRATINLAGQSFTVEQAGRNGVCETQPIQAGQTITGKFDNGDCHVGSTDSSGNQLVRRFSFSGVAGEQIALALEPGFYASTIRLLSPLGLLLLSNTGARLPQTNELYVLPASGNYVVELYGYHDAAYALTLYMLQNGCGYALSASGKRFEAAGGSDTVRVTANGNCGWQARSNADWITVQGAGSGNGTLNYSVAPNTNFEARTGTIILANRVFVIEQAGQRGTCAMRPLQPGQTISGAWDDSDCGNRTYISPYAYYVDRYNFNAVAGASLSVSLNTQADAVIIELYDQTGSLVAAVRSKRFPANVGMFILPVGGAYALHVLSSGTGLYTLTASLNPPGTANNGSTIHLNAANFKADVLAPDLLVTMFGSNLADVTQTAATPAPSLGGTTVQVRDSAGATRTAKLLFVSPTQINYIMPGGLAYGAASITTTNSVGTEMTDTVQIAPVAPGLFSADASGRGLAAGVVLRVKANQAQVFEPLARFDSAQNRFVAVPIDVGVAGEAVYLVLFGTGYRWRSAMTAVTAQLTGLGSAGSPMSLAVSYAGQQGNLGGLDQLNIALPSSLSGRGECEISLSVDGKAANPLRFVVR